MKSEMVIFFSVIFIAVAAYHNRAITIPDHRGYTTTVTVKKSFLTVIMILFVLFSFITPKQNIENKMVKWIAIQAANEATAEELTEGITYHKGEKAIQYYNQKYAPWGNQKYGKTDFISKTGCGPTCLAMVISTLTEKTINPKQMADWAYENGYCAEGSGSYHTLIENALNAFGLQSEQVTILEGQKIADALSQNKFVIALMGKGTFTSSGHFIVLRGITEDGQVLVADPKEEQNNQKLFPLGLILEEAKGGADSLGPFWIIQ